MTTPAVPSPGPARITGQQGAAQLLRSYEPVVAKLLERTGTSPAQFLAQVANACRANPQLWECDHATLLGAVLRSAQLDLAPNTTANLAWIIPRKNRGVLEATWQLGYGGVMELARRAEPGMTFEGKPVYPGDLYIVVYGSEPKFKHVPHTSRRKPRGGDADVWYVLARYPDGRPPLHKDLDREGVEKHRAASAAPNGDLWTTWYDAAALKSVVVEMKPWLPHNRQTDAAYSTDGTVIDVRSMEDIDEQPALEQAGEAEAEEVDDGRPFTEAEP